MPEPLPSVPPPQLTTKTKTRTKAIVATLAIVIGLGIFAAAGVIRSRRDMVCSSGSRAGVACKAHRDCQVAEGDQGARCVWPRRRTSALPDLTFESVVFDPITRRPTVSVINRGSAVALEATPIAVQLRFRWIDSSGTVLGTIHSIGIGRDIAPTEISTYVFAFSIPEGATRLRLNVDDDAILTESDETNNVWEGDLPSLLPDLTIDESPTLTSTEVTYTVRNLGPGSFSGPLRHGFRWLREDGTVFSSNGFVRSVTLGPEESTVITHPGPYSSIPAPTTEAVQLQILIDVPDEIPEVNEENNSVTIRR